MSNTWSGYTKKEIRARMKRLSEKRIAAMSSEDKQAHARLMVAARGSWVNGKYVRKQKAIA